MKKIKIKYILLFISVSLLIIFRAMAALHFGKFNYFWYYSSYFGSLFLFAGIIVLIIKILTLPKVRKILNQ